MYKDACVVTLLQGIPPAFWKHTNRLSTGTVSLQGPSGNIWPVNLITKEGHLFFENGWQEFVRDHSIKCGDVLVFRYDGDSHFKVKLFDSSGCEREDCFSVKPCEDAIMSKADLSSTFSRAHLPKMSMEMLLRVPKVGEWLIGYFCQKSQNTIKYVLSRGWPAFFNNNSLKVGDSMVLEVVHEKEMLVHIFRA
ncbi:hypothetical protein QJS04_geneDACA021887 [Acorus gramineus]|uniref:TF-B3 domain-containing protein n=1 Tax=Acorus gramineus TaxID=55184 RepID=A0AAV9BBQ9_ACOGR|nr:hypothetical protein QJS04_geneDACA022792 [Acorus gramineus]KAK1274398.1 hypothetical protein QJS04_geneDACA021887 [Acorus gramineus]